MGAMTQSWDMSGFRGCECGFGGQFAALAGDDLAQAKGGDGAGMAGVDTIKGARDIAHASRRT